MPELRMSRGVKHGSHAGHAHHGETGIGAREHGHAHTHDHGHGHGHSHTSAPKRVLGLALVLTAGFMLVEAAVGVWSQSLALLADAGHMLADAGALALALVAQQFASRLRTERSTFGFQRAEVLAAFVNGIAITVAALWIVEEAVERWMTPAVIHGTGMLVTACAGLLVNALVAA